MLSVQSYFKVFCVLIWLKDCFANTDDKLFHSWWSFRWNNVYIDIVVFKFRYHLSKIVSQCCGILAQHIFSFCAIIRLVYQGPVVCVANLSYMVSLISRIIYIEEGVHAHCGTEFVLFCFTMTCVFSFCVVPIITVDDSLRVFLQGFIFGKFEHKAPV